MIVQNVVLSGAMYVHIFTREQVNRTVKCRTQ